MVGDHFICHIKQRPQHFLLSQVVFGLLAGPSHGHPLLLEFLSIFLCDIVPNIRCIRIFHDPSYYIRGFSTSWVPRDRTRNVLITFLVCKENDLQPRSSENPFNYDWNDLGQNIIPHPDTLLTPHLTDLDHFCHDIQRDLHEISAVRPMLLSRYTFLMPSQHTNPDPATFMFSAW